MGLGMQRASAAAALTNLDETDLKIFRQVTNSAGGYTSNATAGDQSGVGLVMARKSMQRLRKLGLVEAVKGNGGGRTIGFRRTAVGDIAVEMVRR